MGKNITAVPYVPIAMLSGSAEIPRYFLKKKIRLHAAPDRE
jgi:hypothetical protein